MKKVCVILIALISVEGASANDLSVKQSWLNKHNTYRLKHQAPELKWSDTLADSARKFVNTCPSGHSKSGYGENMAFATYKQTPDNVVYRWYKEASSYDYNNPGFSMRTGHFTQIVWVGTTHVGCAQKDNCSGRWRSIAVCQYDPPGNYLGRFKENVLPPVSTPQKYTIIVVNPKHGKLSCNKDKALKDEKVSCQATPSNGYLIKAWGGACRHESSKNQQCEFKVSGDTSVTVSFKKKASTSPSKFFDGFE